MYGSSSDSMDVGLKGPRFGHVHIAIYIYMYTYIYICLCMGTYKKEMFDTCSLQALYAQIGHAVARIDAHSSPGCRVWA